MTLEMPRALIEDWLPIEALGAESKRERGASSALPPLYFLHVWWARRPLIASRAAILASVLPQWSSNWPTDILDTFPDRASYQAWFTRFLGILGDPVAARKLIDYEKSTGIRTPGNKYGYPRAFARNPAQEDFEILHKLLNIAWETEDLSVLDPCAGGGSIPFESLRYGFTTYANELNPVASFILKGTLDYPARFGPSLAQDIRKWGNRWCDLAKQRLEPYFAAPPGMPKRSIYMWARSVACPKTGKPVPLAPNWWISRGSNPIAIRLRTCPDFNEPVFELARGNDIDFDPSVGTVSGGAARSPWTDEVIGGDYIKREAQAGRMGQVLYCVETETPSGKEYAAPTDFDKQIADRASEALSENRTRWARKDVIPYEKRFIGMADRSANYGILTWDEMFSPRQLLAMGTLVERLRELETEIRSEYDKGKSDALLAYLGFVLDKCPNYNSLLASWIVSRGTIRSVFDRHDFSFKWTFVEFNAPHNLLPWAVDQIATAYEGIANLTAPVQLSLINSDVPPSVERLAIRRGSATSLPDVPGGTIHNITVDPPYYDNVQYAELSDFFYVWLKRSVGHLFPEFFSDELTNKDDEAVANPARFAGMGRKKTLLAEQDYEHKMAAAFREMHRVLHPHGILTVMFTHKRVEAWDTLATALIGAGFTIKASWPVHTEFEHSLHQAKKNAAASTILLVCRKRPSPSDDGAVWWDDLQGRVRRVAREKAREYAAQGISGVDLYLSTFGPTLSVISEHWPVLTSEIDPKTGQPRPLRPETALDLAREEVIRLRKEGLLAGKSIEFDPVTDWYLMAWDAFKAEQFPFDEARKLAIALGLELDYLRQTKKMIAKKGQYVVLQQPIQRRKRGMVDPDAAVFEHWIDALHTAMLTYAEDGAGACDVFLMNRGLKRDTTFRSGLQALINAIPRTRIKGKFVRPEADVLDRMRLAFYADELTVPPEDEPELPQAKQMNMFDTTVEDYELEDVEDEEEDDGEE
jgi:putative DNA methylase